MPTILPAADRRRRGHFYARARSRVMYRNTPTISARREAECSSAESSQLSLGRGGSRSVWFRVCGLAIERGNEPLGVLC